MAAAGVPLRRTPFFQSARKGWFIQWFLPFAGLGIFLIAYPTWAVLQSTGYRYGNYLAPFASPELWGSLHAWFGVKFPSWYPHIGIGTPALLALWAPVGFRLTCYYYRGAYYKAFFVDPPQCAVGEFRHGYWGENVLPLLVQNVHRYFMYIALVFILILFSDAWRSLWFVDPKTGAEVFGIGVGTIILTIDAILLAGYTFGCHSLRNWIGGNKRRFSRFPIKSKCYECVSFFNVAHMKWAWASLIWVCWSDIYVRLLAAGVLHDFRILF